MLNQVTDKGSNSIFRLNKCNEQLKYKTMNEIKTILSYRSKENMFENSILQTKEDPYMTLFNFSFDTDNKNKIYLNNYIKSEIIELKYDL